MISCPCARRAGNIVALARLVALATAIATALAACSSAGTTGARSTSTTTSSCVGQPYVDVRNDLGVAVDVYGYVGSTATYLGTVSTGVQRLPLIQSVGYIYAEYRGRRVSSRRGTSRVSFTRGCERA